MWKHIKNVETQVFQKSHFNEIDEFNEMSQEMMLQMTKSILAFHYQQAFNKPQPDYIMVKSYNDTTFEELTETYKELWGTKYAKNNFTPKTFDFSEEFIKEAYDEETRRVNNH